MTLNQWTTPFTGHKVNGGCVTKGKRNGGSVSELRGPRELIGRFSETRTGRFGSALPRPRVETRKRRWTRQEKRHKTDSKVWIKFEDVDPRKGVLV